VPWTWRASEEGLDSRVSGSAARGLTTAGNTSFLVFLGPLKVEKYFYQVGSWMGIYFWLKIVPGQLMELLDRLFNMSLTAAHIVVHFGGFYDYVTEQKWQSYTWLSKKLQLLQHSCSILGEADKKITSPRHLFKIASLVSGNMMLFLR
jgi:hypothetical protein